MSCFIRVFYCGDRNETKTTVHSECGSVHLHDFWRQMYFPAVCNHSQRPRSVKTCACFSDILQKRAPQVSWRGKDDSVLREHGNWGHHPFSRAHRAPVLPWARYQVLFSGISQLGNSSQSWEIPAVILLWSSSALEHMGLYFKSSHIHSRECIYNDFYHCSYLFHKLLCFI